MISDWISGFICWDVSLFVFSGPVFAIIFWVAWVCGLVGWKCWNVSLFVFSGPIFAIIFVVAWVCWSSINCCCGVCCCWIYGGCVICSCFHSIVVWITGVIRVSVWKRSRSWGRVTQNRYGQKNSINVTILYYIN